MDLLKLLGIIIIIIIGVTARAYNLCKNTTDPKKFKTNMITTVSVYIILLLLISTPIIFILILGKLQGF